MYIGSKKCTCCTQPAVIFTGCTPYTANNSCTYAVYTLLSLSKIVTYWAPVPLLVTFWPKLCTFCIQCIQTMYILCTCILRMYIGTSLCTGCTQPAVLYTGCVPCTAKHSCADAVYTLLSLSKIVTYVPPVPLWVTFWPRLSTSCIHCIQTMYILYT